MSKNLFTFGGYCGHGKCYHNALHQLDLVNLHWKELMATNPEDAPMKKWQCGMVTFNQDGDSCLCLFGGWGILSSASKSYKHEFVADRANPGCIWSNELHFFNINKREWYVVIIEILIALSDWFKREDYNQCLDCYTHLLTVLLHVLQVPL